MLSAGSGIPTWDTTPTDTIAQHAARWNRTSGHGDRVPVAATDSD